MTPPSVAVPMGSTQILPPRHNRVKHLCQSGHVVIKVWGIVHIPRVDSREDRIRLPSEKGRTTNERMNGKQTTLVEIFEGEESKVTSIVKVELLKPLCTVPW